MHKYQEFVNKTLVDINISENSIDDMIDKVQSRGYMSRFDRKITIVIVTLVSTLFFYMLPYFLLFYAFLLTIKNYEKIPVWASIVNFFLIITDKFGGIVPIGIVFLGKELTIPEKKKPYSILSIISEKIRVKYD